MAVSISWYSLEDSRDANSFAIKTSLYNPCKEPKGFAQQVGASLQIKEIKNIYHQLHQPGQYFEVVIFTDDQHTGSGKAHIFDDGPRSTHKPPATNLPICGPIRGVLGLVSWDVLESKPNKFYVTVKVVTGTVGTLLAKVCFYIDDNNVATFQNGHFPVDDQSGSVSILGGDDFTWESRSVHLQGNCICPFFHVSLFGHFLVKALFYQMPPSVQDLSHRVLMFI
jgi:hypothetical protein